MGPNSNEGAGTVRSLIVMSRIEPFMSPYSLPYYMYDMSSGLVGPVCLSGLYDSLRMDLVYPRPRFNYRATRLIFCDGGRGRGGGATNSRLSITRQ